MVTQRFGFDPANTDFDWRTVDEILAALETHDHSGGTTPVALADPTAAPTAAAAGTGGTLANGQTLYYQVSYIDQFGLETAASAELAVPLAATASSTDPPNPTGDTVTGATLPAGTYYYALTVITSAGESALGPPAIISVVPGQNLVHVGLPALPGRGDRVQRLARERHRCRLEQGRNGRYGRELRRQRGGQRHLPDRPGDPASLRPGGHRDQRRHRHRPRPRHRRRAAVRGEALEALPQHRQRQLRHGRAGG